MGMDLAEMRDVRRAALLHDIGKLGVSNLILDKPGRLDAAELALMRRHAQFTYDILKRVPGFDHLAEAAAAHHERLDGTGYFRGISGGQLSPMTRILAVSDMYEALAARRPYRQDLTGGQVMSILASNAGDGICPEVLDALKTFLNQTGFTPIRLAA
jgi:HD-GYP domain-containing protein (c-di-GMP phosphodiesterase class II)